MGCTVVPEDKHAKHLLEVMTLGSQWKFVTVALTSALQLLFLQLAWTIADLVGAVSMGHCLAVTRISRQCLLSSLLE